MSYEITFGGRFQAGLGITTGKVVVKAGSLYLPATTANVALYPITGLVVRYQQVPSANYDVGDIAHAGVWPSSLTGLTAATAGVDTYARLTSTGSLENTTAPADGDWLMGRINTDGDLILVPANEYGGDNTVGAQVVVDIRNYGAVCDGVTDDTAAIEAALADVDVLGIDVIQVPKTAGGTRITRTIRIASDTEGGSIFHLSFEGTVEGPALPPGPVEIIWDKPSRSGSAASITCVAGDVGTNDPIYSQTWTYKLISGCTGANFTASDVGRRIRVTNAANAFHNAQAVIVQVPSATSVRAAFLGTTATTDANNGSISWRVLDPIFELASRGCTIRNLVVIAASGTYAHSGVAYTYPAGTGGSSSSRNELTSLYFYPATGGFIENGLDNGPWVVPTDPAFAFRVLETVSNYPRPFSPYQNDYLWVYDMVLVGVSAGSRVGAWMVSGNTSSQLRSHDYEKVGAVYKEYGFRNNSDYPSALPNGGTCAFVCNTFTGGEISKFIVSRGTDQAQYVIYNLECEGIAAIYEGSVQTGGPIDSLISGGYLGLTGSGAAAVDPLGLIQIQGGTQLNIENIKFIYSGFNVDGVFVTANNTSRAIVNFRGCVLPHHDSFTKNSLRDCFALNSQTCVVNLTDCMLYRSGTGNVFVGDTRIAGGGPASTLGTYDAVGDSMLVRGLSNSLYQAENFFGYVTISGTETRKVWEFSRPEEDEDYASHDYVVLPILVSTSGAASAGSAIATVPNGNKTRRSVCVQVEAAPGGGTSRTFGLMLVRHNVAASTAFHPMEIDGMVFDFCADYDWNYLTTENPSLADNTGRRYWRNQGPIREAIGTTSVMDLYPLGDLPENLPGTRAVDAGYNNKYTITSDANDFMYAGATAANPTIATPCTMFIVGEPGTGAVDKTPFSIYNGDLGTSIRIYANGTTNVRARSAGTEISAAHNWNGKRVVCAVFNGATSDLYISSLTSSVTGATGAAVTSVSGFHAAFDYEFQTQPWAGTGGTCKLARVIVYNSALTTAQRTSVTNYLGTYYGETITP